MEARRGDLEAKLEGALRDIGAMACANGKVRLDARSIVPQVVDATFAKSIEDHLHTVQSEVMDALHRVSSEADAAVSAAGKQSISAVFSKAALLTEENDNLTAALETRKLQTERTVCVRADLVARLEEVQQRVASYEEQLAGKRKLIEAYEARQRAYPVILYETRSLNTMETLAFNFRPATFAPVYVRIVKNDADTKFVEVTIKPGAQVIVLEETEFFSDATKATLTLCLSDGAGTIVQDISNTQEIAFHNPTDTEPKLYPPAFQQYAPASVSERHTAHSLVPDPAVSLAEQIQASFPQLSTIEEVLNLLRATPTYTFESLSRQLIDEGYQAEPALLCAWEVKVQFPTANLGGVLGWFREGQGRTVESVCEYLRQQGYQQRSM